MTVKEFKERVASIPDTHDNWIVVISSDSEGNSFQEFHCVSADDKLPCTQYFDCNDGELYSYNEDDYDSFEEYEEHVVDDLDLTPCIVLWP